MSVSDLNYIAPPTCCAFMKSNTYGRLLAGPVGSGKTVSCIMELFRRALMQSTAADGYRYTRFAIVRQTLKQLKDTILKDCNDWIGSRGLGQWKVSESTFHVNFDDVRSEWVFIPLENAEEQGRLLSMQLTGSWLSECIEMDLSILGPVSGRIGRYPANTRGQPSWMGIIADTNMPTIGSPWQQFMMNLPPEWSLFKQPGGLEPNAENLNNLLQSKESALLPLNHPVRIAAGRRYYDRLVQTYGMDHPWVIRYVHAMFGDDPGGMAVFRSTFKSSFHVVPHTTIVPGYPLLIGQDFGRNPWSTIAQCDPFGRLIIHEEVPGINCGLEKHIIENLRPRLMRDCYAGMKVIAIGDPAGIAKDSHSEENSFELMKRCGIPAQPAPTNDIDPRLRAVEALLMRHIGGTPVLQINGTGAPFLAAALGGGYRFKKGLSGNLQPKPDKDNGASYNGQHVAYSHVVDTVHYLALVVHGGMMPVIMQTLNPPRRSNRVIPNARGWT